MSFAEQLAEISIKRAKVIQDYQMKKFREFEKAKSERENQLMTYLTTKYHKSIKDAIYKAALVNGLREKYMNFEYKDFKANFPELGKPKDVCKRWLDEMCNPESQYLPFKQPEYFDSIYVTHFDNSDYALDYLTAASRANDSITSIERDHFSGLQFDIWNNAAFTVHFTW